MSEEEKIERLLNSIAKGCDGSIADEVKAIIIKQQKEIEKEKNRIMELAELLDKQENEIKFLKGELEIQEGCYISKDKIRELLNQINNEYSILLSNKSLSLERQNKNAQRHEAMRVVLEELLEEK